MMRPTNTTAGFSIIEVLLAGALFAVFAWGVVSVLLTGLEMDQTGEALNVATHYATEGIEAARSIAAADFDTLTSIDATGIERVGGNWSFRGSSTQDTFGIYTRVITIANVNRDNEGQIDESGGSEDPDTKRATVTVTFEAEPGRSQTVTLETFLTRFNPSP